MKTLSEILVKASKVAVVANIVVINLLIFMGNFREVVLPVANITVLYIGIKLQNKFNKEQNGQE